MISELFFYAIIVGTVLQVIYKWVTINKDYFVIRNLKHFEPNFLIGNTTGLFLKRYVVAEFMEMIYYRFPKEKYVTRDLQLYDRSNTICYCVILFFKVNWIFRYARTGLRGA